MILRKTMLSRVAVFGALTACSNSPAVQNDASADAAQEAGPVTCSTPGAACDGGGACFFPVGDCSATTGVCADDSFCTGAPTESVCLCDGTMKALPQCGPGGYALAQASQYGPCASDGGGPLDAAVGDAGDF